MSLKIEHLEEEIDVYDITVSDTENFFADGILIHNCQEISLPVKALNNINDSEAEIALCTLSAINWGAFKTPEDMKPYCEIAVRALDNILDYQLYPVPAAETSTKSRRPLGVGITNLAYWLAKRGHTYDNASEETLAEVHRWAEHWSYYLIEASVNLAKERGPCSLYKETKYFNGILPIDTYKRDLDTIVEPDYDLYWGFLERDMKNFGIRNSTLMAQMPCESSSQLINSTNGIEPPRALVSVKQSKEGVLKQVVPEIQKLGKKYDLLWNQKSPMGYLKICAVLQKFIDQAISVNQSVNPEFYVDRKVSMKDLLTQMLFHYKMGGKTMYYFNSYDSAGEIEIKEEDCENCKL